MTCGFLNGEDGRTDGHISPSICPDICDLLNNQLSPANVLLSSKRAESKRRRGEQGVQVGRKEVHGGEKGPVALLGREGRGRSSY